MPATALDPTVILLLVPLVLLQLGLLVLALLDLVRPERRVRGGNKAIWAVVIALVSMIGPLLYFLVGREESGGSEPPPPGPGARPGWGAPDDSAPVPPSTLGAAPDVPSPAAAVPAWRADPDLAVEGAPGSPSADPAAPSFAAGGTARRADEETSGSGRTPAIEVEGLTKRYRGPGGGVLALDALSLTVPSGSVFGLLGPNGAGKTTTLRLLVGLTRPGSGRATIAGIDVREDVLGVRRQLGYLEQDPRAYGWMTGREQVGLVGRLHGLDGPGLDRDVSAALDRVGLGGAADRRIGTYSGGMRQRLGIASALVHRPPILILDEPVSSLDPEGRRDVLGLIHELRRESTILFSTHVLADVERVCDRVGILDRGRLVVEEPLAALLERYALPVYRIEAEPGQDGPLASLAGRLRELAWVSEARAEHGLLTVAVDDPEQASRELLGRIAASGIAVVSVARARPTLEDVFLRLTGNGRVAA